jgi:hypothetical protein
MDTRTHRTSAILRTITAGAILAGTLASSCGCQVANQALRADFTDFNTILQSNQTQQMLLNLVRMHYRETPLFMQAGSLTASYESSISADSSASIPAGDPSSIDIGGSYRFSSKPTISYTPVEGKEYVQQFMAEITPQTFAMLVRAGWPISKLGELLVASVTLDSGERLVGRPSAASNPRFREFFETLKASEERDDLEVLGRKDGGIDLRAGTLTIGIERFQFRSLFSAMFNASRDVQTPASRASWAKSTPGGQEIDVRVSDKPPVDSLVCVEYAGSYYSIANDDIRSKDTLALLMQLSRIQSGPSAPAPLITIPAR